jgi:hypothetical protein
MARRRSHRRHSRASRRGMTSLRHVRRGLASSKTWKALAGAVGLGAFFQQTTNSDVTNLQGAPWNAASAGQKLTALGVCFIQRITNGSVLSNYTATLGTTTIVLNSKPTWQLGNIFNKWTGAGVGALIYKHLPWVPEKAKVGKFVVPLLAAGIIGGLLDDPSGQAVSRSSAYVRNGPQVNLRGQTTTSVNRNAGGL